MNPYPKYKPSGIEWLPQIPSNWEMSKAKYYFKYTIGFTPPTGQEEYYNGDITWIMIADMNKKVVNYSANTLSQLAIERFKPDLTVKNSLLFSFKLSVGKVCFAGKDLYTNEAILSILPDREYDVRYFYYTLPEQLIQNANENIYGAKMLNQELIRNASICFPPLPEQKAITNFLDAKTSLIDSFIEKKKKLIELLKEERTALINQAVTKGTNPKVKLKPSGIEWLGDIPENWEVKKLKFVANKVQTGSTPPSNEEKYYHDEINWFTPSDFSDNLYLTNSKRKIAELAKIDGVIKEFPAYSILMVGIGATLGKIGYTDEPSTSNQQINAISFENINKVKYYSYFLHSNQSNIVSLSNAATLAILNQSQTKEIPLTVPRLHDELSKIVDFIETETQKIDNTISKIEKEIELMQEYRTALISEVVTGKVRVE